MISDEYLATERRVKKWVINEQGFSTISGYHIHVPIRSLGRLLEEKEALLEVLVLMLRVYESSPIQGLGKPGTSATKIDDLCRDVIRNAGGEI